MYLSGLGGQMSGSHSGCTC